MPPDHPLLPHHWEGWLLEVGEVMHLEEEVEGQQERLVVEGVLPALVVLVTEAVSIMCLWGFPQLVLEGLMVGQELMGLMVWWVLWAWLVQSLRSPELSF